MLAHDRDLRENRKRDLVFAGGELLDGVVAVGLFLTEVITRERENHETLVLVLRIQGLQTFILGSENAVAGDVDDQEHLAAIGGERHRFAIDRERDVIQDRCGAQEHATQG